MPIPALNPRRANSKAWRSRWRRENRASENRRVNRWRKRNRKRHRKQQAVYDERYRSLRRLHRMEAMLPRTQPGTP